jgi:nicotinamidase-related amidase
VSIDTQVDTLDGGPLEITGTSAAVPNITRLSEAFRRAAGPIIHVVRLYNADGSNAEPIRREFVSGPTPILRPGTSGRLLAPGVLAETVELDDERLLAGEMQVVSANEVVMYKPRWGAFYNTALDEHLRRLAVDTVVVCGCNFPNCPRTTIYEASERDYGAVLVTDAISGLYERGEDEMANIGVVLSTTDDVVSALTPVSDAVS